VRSTGGERGRSRRRRKLTLATLLVIGGVAAAWWFMWVPNWRPQLREGEGYGIDVSAHQMIIDWDRVAADGIEFAYVKATEGGDFVDGRFAENWARADEAGLDRGAYHFFTLCTPGAVQARNFLKIARPDPAALAPAVDLELAGNCARRPQEEVVDAELMEFLGIIEDAWGRDVVLYVGSDFESLYPIRDRLDRPLWHRRFLLRPNVDGLVIWQLHGYANVEGIDGGVDLNVMRSMP
jgi:lysozyme